MTPSKHPDELWLQAPDLLHFGLALGVGAFLGGFKPGFWWTVLLAIITAFVLAVLNTFISTRRASMYLRAHGVPGEIQRLVLRSDFVPRFGGTITTILVAAGIVAGCDLVIGGRR